MRIPHPTPRTKVLLSCFGLILALFSIVPGTMLVADTRATEVMDKETEPPTLPDGLSAPEWRSMQELVAAAEYQFTWQVSDGVPAYRAPNRAHDLSLSLTAMAQMEGRCGTGGSRS
jgi:hypothetical protein